MTDDDKALVERLEEWEWTLRAVYKAGDLGTDEPAIVMGEASDRIEALSAEIERLIKAGDGDVGLIHWQGERIEQLEAALRDVFEQWAGSEGFIAETAPEGYLLQLTKRMADIARAPLGDAK